MNRFKAFSPVVAVIVLSMMTVPATAQQIPSPEEFFGHEMGADRKLARWDKLVEYYTMLGERSPRIEVVNMGPSTLGNPFLALYVSAPENIARLSDYKRMNAVLSDPRGHSQTEIDDAIANGKAVLVQSYGLHSTEVAASQTAAEVAYEMASRMDSDMLNILDNTISILIPAFNPDGNIIVTDWYNQWVGTEYEGVGPPELYHHYIGHDNNRDAFMQNTIESFYGAEIIFREWVPQAYVDHHQMGPYTARIFIPPYAEPVRPDGDPLVWREMSWYGAHMGYKLDEADRQGAIGAAIYSGWGHFGFHWITPFHNIAGMLTESASARLATPLFVHPDQLRGSRQLPEYEAQTTFPNPWPGGWWRVRDMVINQKIATFAALDMAARHRETVLKNMYLKASRQTERGRNGETVAFIIPSEQHDALTADKLVNKLLGQGIEVHRAPREFTHDGRVYGAGTHVVSMAQPKRGVIRWLLGRTFYPDNTFTRDREENPIRPYDMSTDNIAEYMGVRVDPVGAAVAASLTVVGDTINPAGEVARSSNGYVIDGRLNDSFMALNMLFAAEVDVRRVHIAGGNLSTGDLIVPGSASAEVLREVAETTGADFSALTSDATGSSYPLTQQRIGMFQRYYGGNIDEGWTRWLLEHFKFEYATMLDKDILDGNLNRNYDVIILPDDGVSQMVGPRGQDGEARTDYPPEWRSGFGQAGIDALEAFVENGGTLVTFARAGDLAIQEFGLPVRNVLANVPTTDFWSPGSTLKMTINNDHAAAFGMPDSTVGLFLMGNHAYAVNPGAQNHAVTRIASFIDRDVLQSGWLVGEDHVTNKASMVSVSHGDGTVVLIGFRAQHRAQTHGTFKLVFNSLVNGPPEMASVGGN
jgi:hypothetical protein